MNLKTLILVIILSVLIGIMIFFFISLHSSNGSILSTALPSKRLTPTPEPTLPPLTPNSNLSEELNKISVPNFEEDFKNLKEEVNNF